MPEALCYVFRVPQNSSEGQRDYFSLFADVVV